MSAFSVEYRNLFKVAPFQRDFRNITCLLFLIFLNLISLIQACHRTFVFYLRYMQYNSHQMYTELRETQ